MSLIQKRTHMQQWLKARINKWAAQKEAQQGTFGRRCAWYASQNCYTDGATADCTKALQPIDSISTEYFLADKRYDIDAISLLVKSQGMNPVIPSRKNKKTPREYHNDLYKLKHFVENAFLHLKCWHGISRFCEPNLVRR